MGLQIKPAHSLQGSVQVPGDKSLSHRYALLSAMASGRSHIENYSTAEDCQRTLDCLTALAVRVRKSDDHVEIDSDGWSKLQAPKRPLDAGNSGTTMRLLAGILAGLPFHSVLAGDDSLKRRPMSRIAEPLKQMGATISTGPDGRPPLDIRGGKLRGIEYPLSVASAQVKSCILLAGIMATGQTVVIEPSPTRDHTERALPHFGLQVEESSGRISIHGPSALSPTNMRIPGDFSSASFILAATLLVRDSRVLIREVGTNPSRTAFLSLLEQAGASVTEENSRTFNSEPVADLLITFQPEVLDQFPALIPANLVSNLIDELPLLAVLGTKTRNGVEVRGAAELRAKESDRIRAVVSNLRALGGAAEEFEDGFRVPGDQVLSGGRVTTYGDHRVAMAFSVAGLISEKGVEIDDPSCTAISFPGFFQSLASLQPD